MNVILEEIRRRGYAGRMVPLLHLAELRHRIETQRSSGLFDEEFFRERLGGFVFEPPVELRDAASLTPAALERCRSCRSCIKARARQAP